MTVQCMRITLSFTPTMRKQTSHWWQNAFSFSSSSSPKSTSDDSLIVGRRGGRSIRQLTRAKKLRHLTDADVEFWRSTPSSFENSPSRLSAGAFSPAAAAPQPLPLPESQTLLRRDAKFASDKSSSGNVPLPSPGDAHQRGYSDAEEREKEKTDGLNGFSNNDGAASTNAVGR